VERRTGSCSAFSVLVGSSSLGIILRYVPGYSLLAPVVQDWLISQTATLPWRIEEITYCRRVQLCLVSHSIPKLADHTPAMCMRIYAWPDPELKEQHCNGGRKVTRASGSCRRSRGPATCSLWPCSRSRSQGTM
jgi:hypothetical protein